MGRPNFFIVGAPRCGTTAMARYLGQHPEVFMAEKKEMHHFGRDVYNDPAMKDRERYLAEFAGSGDYAARGEASVWYLASRHAAREMDEFDPASKVIIMLRNPVDMIFSIHSQLLIIGGEDIEDFKKALEAEPGRREEAGLIEGEPAIRPNFYRMNARVSDRVLRYLDVFGPERVHIVVYDDLRADTAGACRAVFEFLGVDPGFAPDTAPVNQRRSARSLRLHRLSRNMPGFVRTLRQKLLPADFHPGAIINRANLKSEKAPELDPALREELAAELEDEVQKLGEIIGRDLSSWSQTRKS